MPTSSSGRPVTKVSAGAGEAGAIRSMPAAAARANRLRVDFGCIDVVRGSTPGAAPYLHEGRSLRPGTSKIVAMLGPYLGSDKLAA